MTCEKCFHLPGRSAERTLQAAPSLSVCLAPNDLVTSNRTSLEWEDFNIGRSQMHSPVHAEL